MYNLWTMFDLLTIVHSYGQLFMMDNKLAAKWILFVQKLHKFAMDISDIWVLDYWIFYSTKI